MNINDFLVVLGYSNFCDKSVSDNETRLVLIGKTGSGKSATANSILGKPSFISSTSGTSITRHCSMETAFRFNRKLVIVDTPGLFDTVQSNENIQEEIRQCITLTSPGPHAFILVISVAARYTEEEQRSVDHFLKYFGENTYKYFTVLFTRKDELDINDLTIMKHIERYPANLKSFIKKCGNRIIAFNNKLTGTAQDKQVHELLQQIWTNVKNNEGKCFSNEMYIEAEKQIKEKEEQLLRKLKEKEERERQYLKEKLANKYDKLFAQEMKSLSQSELDEIFSIDETDGDDQAKKKTETEDSEKQHQASKDVAKSGFFSKYKNVCIKKILEIGDGLSKKTIAFFQTNEKSKKDYEKEEKEIDKMYRQRMEEGKRTVRDKVRRENEFFFPIWN